MKYGNIKVSYDGLRFDSKKECERYKLLKILEKKGHIQDLKTQVKYAFEYNNVKIGKYIADFTYTESGKFIVEDVKGVRTPLYKFKAKLLKAFHGIEIKEI